MQKPEPSYVPFEQILAFCEGTLPEAAAEQVRVKAIQNPLIQETIINLQRFLRTGSSQNLQTMVDQSLDQFLTQSLTEGFQPPKETIIPKPWHSRIPLLPRSGNIWMRQALILGSIVLIMVVGHRFYQYSVFPAEAKEKLTATDLILNSPEDSSADAVDNNEALTPSVVPKNETLLFPEEVNESALTATDPALLPPEDLSADVLRNDEAMSPTVLQRIESLVFALEIKNKELISNDPTLSYPDDLSIQIAENEDVLNPSVIRKSENQTFPRETKELGPIISDSTLVFPGGFSPNGDGNNDVFTPKLIRKIKVFHEFSIYNRWGEQMYTAVNFSPKSKKKEWDGTFEGEPAEEGTYVFVVRLQNALGAEEIFTGNLVLMR